ncbi:MAG: SDR family oxidoreductase [Planctomycetota bacterium]|jgi:NADH dehydrogenase
MRGQELHIVTGAFGYSGRYIAQRLADAGHAVRTLTNSPQGDHPFGDRIDVRPLSFVDRDRLVESLSGAAVLYNTYWVRFNHRTFTFADAVRNTRALFAAAEQAGVGRVVHVSITNPSEDSPLEYFRGKASPGCCESCRSSASSGTAATSSSRSTWTISRPWRWSTGAGTTM